jgi:hypothetical protein
MSEFQAHEHHDSDSDATAVYDDPSDPQYIPEEYNPPLDAIISVLVSGEPMAARRRGSVLPHGVLFEDAEEEEKEPPSPASLVFDLAVPFVSVPFVPPELKATCFHEEAMKDAISENIKLKDEREVLYTRLRVLTISKKRKADEARLQSEQERAHLEFVGAELVKAEQLNTVLQGRLEQRGQLAQALRDRLQSVERLCHQHEEHCSEHSAQKDILTKEKEDVIADNSRLINENAELTQRLVNARAEFARADAALKDELQAVRVVAALDRANLADAQWRVVFLKSSVERLQTLIEHLVHADSEAAADRAHPGAREAWKHVPRGN